MNEVVKQTEAKKEKISNIVAFPDGNVDFGEKGKSISYYDVPSRTLTFKVVTGETIRYTLTEEESAGLSDNVIEHILYARMEKIKSTLAPVKPVLTPEEIKDGKLNVAQKIRKELDALAAGEFVTRTITGNNVTLNNWFKAMATLCAYGTILGPNNEPMTMFSIKPEDLPTGTVRPEWKDLSKVEVIADVLAFWKSLSKDTKTIFRRSTWIGTQKNLIDDGVVKV